MIDATEMRLVTPYTVIVFVVLWTVVFLLASRRFLFSAHQVNHLDSHIQTLLPTFSSALT